MPYQFQIVIFAAIAAVVLFSLYNVLGKKVGRQPEDNADKAPPAGIPPAEIVQAPKAPPPVDPLTAAAAAPLKARDPAFDPNRFLEGARTAYETIVRGYASGDRGALKPLLTEAVMGSFEAGITAREGRGEREEVEFIQAPRADLESTSVAGDRASAKVRFLAELRNRVIPVEGEPVIEERRTAEHWTFERTLGASDPNWVLARVEPAEA
ncbi:TIM44-related membrane protein TimA [Brevundimonas balnearis]|uniref:TIM44-related membrane protein TimA n=1 Tax=Brevundimonas balnearis TaxID=1572858 RepID=A0ABV6R4W2_9CAUL